MDGRLGVTTQDSADLTPLIRPRSVAVLGASAKRVATGNEVLANLVDEGFGGELLAVHREATSIDGIPAVHSVEDLPEELDLAFLSLPAPAVMPSLRALAERGCRAAIVPGVGMAAEDQRALVGLAAASPMRILGPNCMGLLNYTDRIPLWIAHRTITNEPPGHTALVAQSGSACILIVRSAPTVGFSKVISSGNELGVTMGDYLSWLADDPATSTVAVVIESLRDVDSFTAAVGKLRRAGKPLVALKVGRSARGLAATVAHTGALVGAGRAYDALFDDLDIPSVGDYDEMASVLECFAHARTRAATGSRVALVTISGGQAAMAADLAERCGTPLAELAPETVTRLRELTPDAEVGNPFDIGASVGGTHASFTQTLIALAEDPGVDTVIPVLDSPHTMTEHEVSFPRRYFESVAAVAPEVRKPLIIASTNGLEIHPLCRDWVGEVPILRGMHNALIAARALPRNRAPVPDAPARPPGVTVADELRQATRGAGFVSHEVGRQLLAAYGIPAIPSVLVSDPETAVEAATQIGYPVVLKVASPDIAHRSDIGAVITGIADADGARQALETIESRVRRARPGATIEGFEIQAHIADALEAIIGFVADPVFGATMSVGSGGALVELVPDLAVAPAPLTRRAARDAISRSRLARLAGGYRNLVPPTDLEPLATALEALSWLAADFGEVLAEVDLNPVLVEHGTGRVLVVDALFVARAPQNSAAFPGESS